MHNILVTNRDGDTELLDISKIKEKTSKAVYGLKGVSQDDLEASFKIELFSGIETQYIQRSLINSAMSKIDIDQPNWTFVAARLFLEDKYHTVGKILKNKKGSAYPHLKNYLEYGVKIGRIVPSLIKKYTDSDIEELNDLIQDGIKSINGSEYHEKDYQFNYLGIKTLFDRYIIKDSNKNDIELPQLMFMGISMFLALNEDDKVYWAKKFYEKISSFEVMLATPTLSNARTPRHQLSSCYVTSTPDNIEGIFDTFKEHGLLSKFGGGIGSDWNLIRSINDFIDGHANAAGGVIPFLKIENDIAIAVDQLGTRKGAIATYIEPWNIEINDFLDLKKNSGEERRRAHDIFPALWINDLFMKRVQEDANWTLFNSGDVNLSELYGEDFEQAYIAYENDDSIKKEVISAKDLWKKILVQYFETGNPFLCFKDNANRANPNMHDGLIRSSNLCTEIFQNTEPDKIKVEITLENGQKLYMEENDIFVNDEGVEKKASKVTILDSIAGQKVFFVQKISEFGKTAVCNLGSINLSKVNTSEKIKEVVPIAVRMLDNVIDLNFYPTLKAKLTNLSTRAIGLGVMGEAQMLAESKIHWGSQEHLEKIDSIMESISYYTIDSSSNLAKERGFYNLFKGSNWEKGIFPMDTVNNKTLDLVNRKYTENWDELKKKVAKYGMRNGYLMAVAPTSSISILVGTTQAVEPIFKKKWLEDNMSGLIPVCAPNISPDTWEYYVSAYDLNQIALVEAAAIRQKWIDQGQSLNIFIRTDKASGKYFNSIYMRAWELGLKSTYYLRSQSPEALQETSIEDRSIECYGCQ